MSVFRLFPLFHPRQRSRAQEFSLKRIDTSVSIESDITHISDRDTIRDDTCKSSTGLAEMSTGEEVFSIFWRSDNIRLSFSIPGPWSYILFRQNNNANRDNQKQPTNNLYTNATQYYSTCIYTHTHSECKSNGGGGHCVRQTSCVLVAAATGIILALFFFVPSLLQLSNSIPLCFFCLDKWTPTRPHLLTPTYGVFKAPLLYAVCKE